MPHAHPTASELLLRRARIELEQGLRAGRAVRAEDLFATYPALTDDREGALELIYSEFVIREEMGHSPSPEEWYARFPELRYDLKQVFQIHSELTRPPREWTQP